MTNGAASRIPWGVELAKGLAFPLVLGFVGYWYTETSKERDRDLKMIELSIGILNADVQPENIPVREWAVDVIDEYSEVPIPPGMRTILVKAPLKLKFPAGAFGGLIPITTPP